MATVAAASTTSLGLDNLPEGAGEIGLDKDVSFFWYLTARQKKFFRIRPLRKDWLARLNVLDPQFINREPVSKFDGRLHNFGQGFCAELVQRRDTGVEHRGNSG